jgi:hypothetical protein
VIANSMVDGYQHFGENCYIHLQVGRMETEAAFSLETLITATQATWHHIRDDRDLKLKLSERRLLPRTSLSIIYPIRPLLGTTELNPTEVIRIWHLSRKRRRY